MGGRPPCNCELDSRLLSGHDSGKLAKGSGQKGARGPRVVLRAGSRWRTRRRPCCGQPVHEARPLVTLSACRSRTARRIGAWRPRCQRKGPAKTRSAYRGRLEPEQGDFGTRAKGCPRLLGRIRRSFGAAGPRRPNHGWCASDDRDRLKLPIEPRASPK